MSDVSRTTATRLRLADQVGAAIDVQGSGIAASAEATMEVPDGAFGPALATAREALARAATALRDADAVLLAERTDDASVRARRDDAVDALRETYVSTRTTVQGVYGATALAPFGLTAAESRPDLRLAQAQNAATGLTTAEATPRLSGAELSLTALAPALEEAADALDAALQEVDREVREEQLSVVARDRAAERWTQAYTVAANLFVGLALAAGERALAERLRPTERRRLGLEEAEEAATANP